jgi:ATP-dependent Clp protease ATP-binding subunit ClpA
MVIPPFLAEQGAEEMLTRKSKSSNGAKMLREEVTEIDIAEVVSKWTGALASRVTQTNTGLGRYGSAISAG